MLRAVAASVLLSLSAFAQPIQPSWIAPHVRFLADSALEGRDTGSVGYDVAAHYVATQFELLGLKPAGDGGTYFQKVRIRKSAIASDSAALTIGGHALQFGREFFIHPSGNETGIDVSGALVFAGFGITAPGQKWDDYASTDVRGKIVVVLPGTPASWPKDVRAVYAIVATRVATAKRHGALAVMFLNPDMPADHVRERQIRQLDATMWVDDSGTAHSAYFADSYVIVPKEGVAAVLANQPQSIEDLRKRESQAPYSTDLNATATIRARFERHDSDTVNVAASVPGGDLAPEYVVLSAHLDHDGMSDYFAGDHVLHGALDNAGGIATILAVARAFRQSERPRRSVVFLAVTGEEKGLVGSDYFVHHPTVPRDAIAADINCDNFLWYVPLKDVTGVGLPYSSLADDFAAAAQRDGLQTSPPPAVGPNLLVLSDHYSFLRAGIPAVSVFNGEQSGDDKRTGTQIFNDYMRDIHHTPKDSIDQAIDWNAAATEARFVFFLAQQIANEPARPRFNAEAFDQTSAGSASAGTGASNVRN